MENTYKKQFQVTDDLLATQGQRFADYIIDLIFQTMLMVVLSVLIGLICAYFGAHGFQTWMDNTGQFENYILGAIMTLIYYNTSEILMAKTLGKLITKTIVVDEFGNKPSAGIIFKRTFCRLIPFNHFSFLGGNARGWHDSISDTYVVNEQLLEIRKKQFDDFEEIGKSIE